MNNNKMYDEKVYCCCYKYHTKQSICCLGMADSENTTMTFDNGGKRKEFMKSHCYPPDERKRCVLYQPLYKENEDKPDEDQ